MNKTISLLLIGICSLLNTDAQSLNARLLKAIEKAIGSDLKGYKFYSYPTDNFGVLTCYDKKDNDKYFITDTWNCIGHKKPPTDSSSWMDVYGYVVPSGGGSIEVDDQTKKDYGFSIALPKIADILSVGVGFDKNSTQIIDISIGKAYKRKLLPDNLIAYFDTTQAKSLAKKGFEKGTLKIIVADVVITGIKAKVTLSDSTTIANIEAKIGSSKSKVFSDASLKVKIAKVKKGTYTLSINHPVIFAYLPKRQPGAGELGAKRDVEEWPDGSAYFPNDPTLLKNSGK